MLMSPRGTQERSDWIEFTAAIGGAADAARPPLVLTLRFRTDFVTHFPKLPRSFQESLLSLLAFLIGGGLIAKLVNFLAS